MRCKLYAPYATYEPVEFWFIVGPGQGYLRDSWVSLNRGPGAAVEAGHNCGHAWPNHCNSAHCAAVWCRAPGSRLAGWLFVGHTLRFRLPMRASAYLRNHGWC